MSKTEGLLKVLDMPEVEQWEWLHSWVRAKYFKENSAYYVWFSGDIKRASADHAFRLRDEVLKKEKFWYGNLHIVYCHVKNMNINYDITPGTLSQYFLFEAKPIHWIIAALIAKEKANAD